MKHKIPTILRAMVSLMTVLFLVSCDKTRSNFRNYSDVDGKLSAVFYDFLTYDRQIVLSWTTESIPDRWIIQRTTNDSSIPRRQSVDGKLTTYSDKRQLSGYSYTYTLFAEFDTPSGGNPVEIAFKAITIQVPEEGQLNQWIREGSYSGAVENQPDGNPQVRINWNYPDSPTMARWEVGRQPLELEVGNSVIVVGAVTPIAGSHQVVDTTPSSTSDYFYNCVLVNDTISPEGNLVQMRITTKFLVVYMQKRLVELAQ